MSKREPDTMELRLLKAEHAELTDRVRYLERRLAEMVEKKHPFERADILTPSTGSRRRGKVDLAAYMPMPEDELLKLIKPVCINGVAGVYFLLNHSDEIVYIGKSENVFLRLGQHCADAKKRRAFSKAGVLAVPDELLFEVERLMIQAYKPYLNKRVKYKTTPPEDSASKATAKKWPRTMAQRYARKG